MKKILTGAVAAIALVGIASPAAAQTHVGTAQLHYAGGPFSPLTNPSGLGLIGAGVNELAILGGIGTRYTALSLAPNNTEAAEQTVTTTFTLNGEVTKDCSFYAGNTPAARTINFGVIGVRTGNNENTSSAFEMAGPASANVNTLTAGCNFNNNVVITKNDAQGLVNNAPGGYDTDEFQANIPYEVTATWSGVAYNTVGTGGTSTLQVADNQQTNNLKQGAWRSPMNIAFYAAPVTNKGLVAGTYTGTTTLTLSAE